MCCTLVRPEWNSDPLSIVLTPSGLESKPVLPPFHIPFPGPLHLPTDHSLQSGRRDKTRVECARLSLQCPPCDAASLLTSCSRGQKGAQSWVPAQAQPRCRSVAAISHLVLQNGWQIFRSSCCGQRFALAKLSSRSERVVQEVPRPAQNPGFPFCHLEGWRMLQELRSPSTRASDPTVSSSTEPRPLSAWAPLLLP